MCIRSDPEFFFILWDRSGSNIFGGVCFRSGCGSAFFHRGQIQIHSILVRVHETLLGSEEGIALQGVLMDQSCCGSNKYPRDKDSIRIIWLWVLKGSEIIRLINLEFSWNSTI